MIQIIIGTVEFDLFLHQAHHPFLLKFLGLLHYFVVLLLKIWAFENMFFEKYNEINRFSFIPQFNAQGMIILSGYLQGAYNCHQEEFYFFVNPQAPVTFCVRSPVLTVFTPSSFLTQTFFCVFDEELSF